MITTDVMIMIDDDYRICDDHCGSASSAVKSSCHRLRIIIHHIIHSNARYTQKPLKCLALYSKITKMKDIMEIEKMEEVDEVEEVEEVEDD